MGTKITDKLNCFSEERKKRIEERTRELVAMECTLQELRKSRGITQEKLAELLNKRQDSVSRMESRDNARLSTIREYILALGGELILIARFEDMDYKLQNFSTVEKDQGASDNEDVDPAVSKCVEGSF